MMATNDDAAKFTMPSEREVMMTRVFDAPRELVWRAYTDPNLITRWWGPRYLTTTIDKMDLRPGGAWRYVSRAPDGKEFGFHGVFREIAPPARLAWTFEFEGMPGHVSVDTVRLEEHAGGKTKVTVTSLFDTKADRDGMVASGMESGQTEGTERLAELLKEMKGEMSPKEIAVSFLRSIGSGRPKEGLRFFAPDCETHNPFVAGGMEALTDAMLAVQKGGPPGGSKSSFELTIRHVLADGDLVAVHTELSSSNPDEGGLRQVHLFRFQRGDKKVVEYWDITQQVQENSPNAKGAFDHDGDRR
jgi:uncharacterized protein YndB with AHSA1/START domain/predicted SnoaL-like aldol condensation-catalyzing enzyme